jgi:hypothetical protein
MKSLHEELEQLTQKKRRVRKKRRVSGKSWDGVIGRSSAA